MEGLVFDLNSRHAANQAAEGLECRIILKGKSRVEHSVEFFEFAAGEDFDGAVESWELQPEGILKDRAAVAISKGAPAERKAVADELVRSLSEHDRELAR